MKNRHFSTLSPRPPPWQRGDRVHDNSSLHRGGSVGGEARANPDSPLPDQLLGSPPWQRGDRVHDNSSPSMGEARVGVSPSAPLYQLSPRHPSNPATTHETGIVWECYL